MKYITFELRTEAACAGTLTTRCCASVLWWMGSQTRAGRFRFSRDSSASSR